MRTYHPLDASKREIRVLRISKPIIPLTPDNRLECALLTVSLDDFHDQYSKVLDATNDASRQARDLLWRLLKRPGLREELQRADVRDDYPHLALREAVRLMDENESLEAMAPVANNRYKWGDFFALSYEWGDPGLTAPILVNENEIHVTRNLEAALRSICRYWWASEEYEEEVYLWADAICINQHDVPERNSQVRLMGEIYTLALRVCTWTGPGFEHDIVAQNVVDKVVADRNYGENNFESLSSSGSLLGWRILFAIASRSYWQRLWIIQEQLLGFERSAIFLNTCCIPLPDLILAMRFLIGFIPIIFKRVLEVNSSSMADAMPMLQLFNYVDIHGTFKHNTPELLLRGARANQKDKRDKIYGLLSLMDPTVRDSITVDYSLPYTVIYRDFVRCCAEKTGRLDHVYQLADSVSLDSECRADGQDVHGTNEYHLPSWAPDWSSLDVNNIDLSTVIAVLHDRRAGSDTTHVPLKEVDMGILTCRGFLFDTVDGLGCSRDAGVRHDEHDLVAPSSSDFDRATIIGMSSMKEYVWHGITMGALTNKRVLAAKMFGEFPNELIDEFPYYPNIESSVTEGSGWKPTITQWQRCNHSFKVFGVPLPAFFAQEVSNAYLDRLEEVNWTTVRFLGTLKSVVALKRIITTARGYLGMAPKASKQGDSIFLLKGCNTPLVLRPSGDGTYYLVGGCFVPGIMDGEAMDQFLQDDSVPEMNVALR